MTTGIKATENRFAFLKVQDSDSDEHISDSGFKTVGKTKTKPTNNAKKRARRRKKKEVETGNSMQSLDSFSEPLAISSRNEHTIRDQKLVEKLYEDDLWKAVELSKLAYEKEQERHFTSALKNPVPEHSNEKLQVETSSHMNKTEKQIRKEEKQKNKAAKTVSLQQFQQYIEDSLPIKPEPPKSHSLNGHQEAGDFFNKVDADVAKIKTGEMLQEKTTTAAAIESIFINERTRDKLSQKNEKIKELELEVGTLRSQNKNIKKRNQQLLVILQQGEMKGKSEMLIEIEKLNSIRDELTTEVTELHEKFERERSKVSKLTDEIKMLKHSKVHEAD
uniref:G kinase-anchoring protein 1-like n=1 Tax=Ciona intestinalis TaxID=7719 RepID=UPI000180CBD2|nr:G kinase-anchoring protein 1-like [Ciona intestinalis]|eukprot:XP_002125501.1 G kinase-anchoring protein 1-like [Ciona intestinalis]